MPWQELGKICRMSEAIGYCSGSFCPLPPRGVLQRPHKISSEVSGKSLRDERLQRGLAEGDGCGTGS